jgi:glycogen synthase
VRILLTTDTLGGVWDYTAALARLVVADGHELLLAIIGEPSPDQVEALPAEVEVEWRPVPLEWMPGGMGEVDRTSGWLRVLAGRWGAEVVHLNQMAYTGGSPFDAPTLVVAHSDVASWFAEVRGTAPPLQFAEYMSGVRRGLAGADVVAAPTSYQAERVERFFGREVERVIPNGAEIPSMVAPREAGFSLISAGRAWDEAKGIGVLDRALQIMGAAAPPGDLFGPLEGPDGESFVPARLRCHGRVTPDRVHAAMRGASVYVAPSLYEPFGLSPLEAAANGCALLLSDIGSFRELWDGAADFFPPGDAAALAAAIGGLSGDSARLSGRAAAARRRALDRYSLRAFGDAYLSLYQEMASGRGRSALPSQPGPVARRAR